MSAVRVSDDPARRAVVDVVVCRYEAGESIRAIGRAEHFAYTTVRNMLVARGVRLRARGQQRRRAVSR